MSALTLRLPDALKRRAMLLAKARGISFTALVTLALDEYVCTHGAGGDGAVATASTSPGANARAKSTRSAAVMFECPRRVRPPGILGADFLTEYRRSVDLRWLQESDPRRLET